MFTTWVMMCVLGAPPDSCLHFEDRYGPYKTEEECYDRAVEAAADLGVLHFGVPLVFSYKCEKSTGI